ERAGGRIEDRGHGYDDEIVWAVASLASGDARSAAQFDARTRKARTDVRGQLASLGSSGKRIAIWGGAGKSAAFMARHEMDAARFPIVVDSDPTKVGTFVPGTGQ